MPDCFRPLFLTYQKRKGLVEQDIEKRLIELRKTVEFYENIVLDSPQKINYYINVFGCCKEHVATFEEVYVYGDTPIDYSKLLSPVHTTERLIDSNGKAHIIPWSKKSATINRISENESVFHLIREGYSQYGYPTDYSEKVDYWTHRQYIDDPFILNIAEGDMTWAEYFKQNLSTLQARKFPGIEFYGLEYIPQKYLQVVNTSDNNIDEMVPDTQIQGSNYVPANVTGTHDTSAEYGGEDFAAANVTQHSSQPTRDLNDESSRYEEEETTSEQHANMLYSGNYDQIQPIASSMSHISLGQRSENQLLPASNAPARSSRSSIRDVLPASRSFSKVDKDRQSSSTSTQKMKNKPEQMSATSAGLSRSSSSNVSSSHIYVPPVDTNVPSTSTMVPRNQLKGTPMFTDNLPSSSSNRPISTRQNEQPLFRDTSIERNIPQNEEDDEWLKPRKAATAIVVPATGKTTRRAYPSKMKATNVQPEADQKEFPEDDVDDEERRALLKKQQAKDAKNERQKLRKAEEKKAEQEKKRLAQEEEVLMQKQLELQDDLRAQAGIIVKRHVADVMTRLQTSTSFSAKYNREAVARSFERFIETRREGIVNMEDDMLLSKLARIQLDVNQWKMFRKICVFAQSIMGKEEFIDTERTIFHAFYAYLKGEDLSSTVVARYEKLMIDAEQHRQDKKIEYSNIANLARVFLIQRLNYHDKHEETVNDWDMDEVISSIRGQLMFPEYIQLCIITHLRANVKPKKEERLAEAMFLEQLAEFLKTQEDYGVLDYAK